MKSQFDAEPRQRRYLLLSFRVAPLKRLPNFLPAFPALPHRAKLIPPLRGWRGSGIRLRARYSQECGMCLEACFSGWEIND